MLHSRLYMALLLPRALVVANGLGRDRGPRGWDICYETVRQGSNCALKLHRGPHLPEFWCKPLLIRINHNILSGVVCSCLSREAI
jgi:hypothetical protein